MLDATVPLERLRDIDSGDVSAFRYGEVRPEAPIR